MINYELAKQLKDSGFSQTYNTKQIYVGRICGALEVDHLKCNDYDCYVVPEEYPNPTLEELIDACGDGFRSLERYYSKEKGITWTSNDLQVWYQTPEEAVAELWLELYGI